MKLKINDMKYILTNKNRNTLLKINIEDLKFDVCERAPLEIDYSWFIEEDGLLEYASKTYEVKAGDTVIMLYSITKETQNLPYKDRVREILVIERDSAFGKYINRRHTEILEESKKELETKEIGECCTESCSN